MELPSGQLPISPAIMCWKKLVEKGAKAQGAEASQGTQLPFPPELLPVLAKATSFNITAHILCFSLGWEGAVAQGMWQQFEEPFSSLMRGLGRWWWLLGCAAVHDIVTESFLPILWQWQFLSFWFLLTCLLLPRTAPHRRLPWTWIIKAILSMIICTSLIFCSHGFFFFSNKQHNY